jgi:hypothetical protein
MATALAALAALAALQRTGAGECVVSRRLPPFALRAVRKSAGEVAVAAPAPASQAPGGACHMGLLARVAAHEDPTQKARARARGTSVLSDSAIQARQCT